jgi:Family of unknown function (DUF6188)
MSSLNDTLIGASLKSLEKKDYSWFFRFGESITIETESDWRCIADGHIVVTSSDHGQKFGLPAPVDAIAEIVPRISGRPVRAASIGEATGDLQIDFGDGLQLQFIQMSSGYESWHLMSPGFSIICGGGGRLG